MFIRKAQAGSAPGHTWGNDGDVIEVDNDLAQALLDIPNGGFSEAEPPTLEPEPEPVDEPDTGREPEPVRKKGGRPRLPRDEQGNIVRDTEDPTDTETE